ncbi:MAG: hypothetical protein WCI21_01620 [Alphaproteobacteria bacterium]
MRHDPVIPHAVEQLANVSPNDLGRRALSKHLANMPGQGAALGGYRAGALVLALGFPFAFFGGLKELVRQIVEVVCRVGLGPCSFLSRLGGRIAAVLHLDAHPIGLQARFGKAELIREISEFDAGLATAGGAISEVKRLPEIGRAKAQTLASAIPDFEAFTLGGFRRAHRLIREVCSCHFTAADCVPRDAQGERMGHRKPKQGDNE